MLIDMVVCSIHSTVFMNRAVRLFSQQITKIVERVSDQCDWFEDYHTGETTVTQSDRLDLHIVSFCESVSRN